MPSSTAAPWSLPYPNLSDPDNVPSDMQSLASRLNTVLATLQLVSEKGAASGYASLDAGGKVPAAQLPSTAAATRYAKVTEKDVVNTTTLTDLLNGEITIGAGVMSATGVIVVRAGGDYLNNSGGAKGIRFQLRLGGVTIWDATSSGSQLISDANRVAWTFHAVIQGLTTSSQRTHGQLLMGYANQTAAAVGTGAIGPGSSVIVAPFYGASAANMVTASLLELRIAHNSANAATSIRLEQALVEVT